MDTGGRIGIAQIEALSLEPISASAEHICSVPETIRFDLPPSKREAWKFQQP